MRFGIRDLLWVTAGASLYSLVLAAYASRGRLVLGTPFDVGIFDMVAVAFVVGALLAYRSLGKRLLVVRRWYTSRVHWVILGWVQHASFAFVLACYVGFCHWRGDSGSLLFLAMVGLQQFTFVFNDRFALAQEGVRLGLAFIPWSECEVRLIEDGSLIEYSHRGSLLPPRWPVKNSRFAVPTEKLDEVRVVLAAKQATADDTPNA